MGKSRKILRVCLVFVVLSAVILGLTYYLYNADADRKISEGTLISCVRNLGDKLWR